MLAVRGTSASVSVRNDSKMQVSYVSICNALVESDFGKKMFGLECIRLQWCQNVVTQAIEYYTVCFSAVRLVTQGL